MSLAAIKAGRDSRIIRAMRQEWRAAKLRAERNYTAAARWDRVFLRLLAANSTEAA
jgi:hypothetical protein